ncbi:hypothetical protein RB195_014866 [Necator americanus]|uniref:Ribosomal protein S21 n=3 Tax=Necator americanus TaxID=51031 RepID=A0ABR1E1Y0_NECAM
MIRRQINRNQNNNTKSEYLFSSNTSQMVRRWRGTLTQPFAVKLFKGIWNAHPRFATRTVMVKNNDVDSAFSLLNRLLDAEGLLKIVRRTQFYQKPYMQRKQLSIEASTAIFNEDMNRKMHFLMRKNRPDAYPGQITT